MTFCPVSGRMQPLDISKRLGIVKLVEASSSPSNDNPSSEPDTEPSTRATRAHLDPATRRWLAMIGRRGGKSTSPAKQVAAARAVAARLAKLGEGSYAELARKAGISRQLLHWRLKRGVPLNEALAMPVRQARGKQS